MKLKLFIYIFAFLNLIPCFAYCTEQTYLFQSKFQTDTIFIQQASAATLKQNPDIPGEYLLTLRGLYPKILYLTSRSKHYAGSMDLKTFLKNWQRHAVVFKNEGPSAIISYLSFKPTSTKGVETDVLELSKPIYNPGTNSITFKAKGSRGDALKTGRFKNVVIVYDGLNVPKHSSYFDYRCNFNNTPVTQEEI